jgi:hypothetical protein
MMTALLFYSYATGVFSSRKIEESIPFLVENLEVAPYLMPPA